MTCQRMIDKPQVLLLSVRRLSRPGSFLIHSVLTSRGVSTRRATTSPRLLAHPTSYSNLVWFHVIDDNSPHRSQTQCRRFDRQSLLMDHGRPSWTMLSLSPSLWIVPCLHEYAPLWTLAFQSSRTAAFCSCSGVGKITKSCIQKGLRRSRRPGNVQVRRLGTRRSNRAEHLPGSRVGKLTLNQKGFFWLVARSADQATEQAAGAPRSSPM